MNLPRTLLFSVLAALLLPAAATAQAPMALTVDDVIELTRLGASEAAQTELIRSSCVVFPLDAGATARLRTAGVSDAILEVVGSACFAGAELVVESEVPGIEVVVDGQRVGVTPWSGRFAEPREVRIQARAGSRTLDGTARLELGTRTKAVFAFPEEVGLVPPVRSIPEIAQQLQVERQWRPTSAQPVEPTYPSPYGGPVAWLVNLGGAAGGAYYCKGAANYCWLDPEFDEDGVDSMEPVRMLAGGVAGLLVGVMANSLIGKGVDSARRSSYESAVARRAEWDRTNEAARAEWVRNHPDVLATRRSEEEARQAVEARNAAIAERNRGRRPFAVMSEPLARAGAGS